MKEYLKMADVFPIEIKTDDESGSLICDEDGIILESFAGDKVADYTLHAINSHDELVEEVDRLHQVMQRCCDALYIADKFCGNHTADECDDSIAIPIKDALVEAAKELAK